MVNRIKHTLVFTFVIAVALWNSGASLAQTTAFTYQGRLTDGGNPATGIYDLTFKLFDTAAVGSGAQQGATLSLTGVEVTNGVFSVQLDFGACAGCFDGADRFLEIGIKPAGGGAFTTLEPRQALTASPYAIKSLSAATADGLSLTCVSCVTSSQIASVNGSAVNGAIPVASVPAGSASYIQNTTTQQAAANFNISGNGTAGGTLTANGVSVNAGGLTLNDSLLRLRGANDPNHGIAWSPVVDGPEFRSFSGFRWQNGSVVLTERMRLDGSGNLTVGGQVGIGSNPNLFKLEVRESGINGLRVQTDTPGGLVASFGGPGDFFVDAPNISGGRLAVRENGRVGIGTANPAEKLTVAGTIQSTAGGFRFPDGTLQTTAIPSGATDTYTNLRSSLFDIPPVDGTPQQLASINIPAGNFLINVVVDFLNFADLFAQENRRSVLCEVAGEFWRGTLPERISAADPGRLTWSMHTVKIFTQPTTLRITCVATNGGTDQSFVKVGMRRLTATRLGGISQQ